MKIVHYYRIQNVNGTETERKVEHIRENFRQIKSVRLEYCFNVGITGDKLSIPDERKLKWLLSDPIREGDGRVFEESWFDPNNEEILIEIGPR